MCVGTLNKTNILYMFYTLYHVYSYRNGQYLFLLLSKSNLQSYPCPLIISC